MRLLLLTLPLLWACGGGAAAPVSTATVDTLANGATRVRSTAQGQWAAQELPPWRLVEDLRIGRIDGAGPDVFGSVRNLVPDALGRVWVMDSQALELRLFDGSGGHVRTVGRQGNGPGEFGRNPCAFAGPDDEVWVEADGRWQRFDSAGVYLGGMPVVRNLGCGIQTWTDDGRFVVVHVTTDPVTRERGAFFTAHRLTPEGTLTPGDTVVAPVLPEAPSVTFESADGRGRYTVGVPFWPRPSNRLTASGAFWISEGGPDYRLVRRSLEGDTVLVIEREHTPVAVPPNVRDSTIAALAPLPNLRIQGEFDPEQVPHVYPPFDYVHEAEDGTLWVFRTGEGARPGIDVFSREGVFLGPVELPPELAPFGVREITREHFWGVATDAFGVQYAVRLRIERPGG